MLKYTLRAICLVIISLIMLGQMARADVTQNVTFTVKNNGVVEATSDIGTFTDDMVIHVPAAEMPPGFNNMDSIVGSGSRFYLMTPVGYNMLSEPGPRASRLPLSFRLKKFVAQGVAVSRFGDGWCDGGTSVAYGVYRLTTDGKSFNYTRCDTRVSFGTGGTASFFVYDLYFSFMENIGGKSELSKMKLPAGTYTFQPKIFTIRHNHGGNTQGFTEGNWYVKVTVVVEPSIASVNIPATLPIDVAVENSNQLTGKGSVLATVTGNLGSNLKILPASANNGQLVKGAERIPYTLSVVPLSGDNKSRLLIDGNKGGAQSQVVIETDEKRDQYQFRFDASFATTLSNLSSGRFSDNVTLIFTTTDLP